MTDHKQRGFTMLELMVVIAILTAVMAVVFVTIDSVQKRSQTEEMLVSITQDAREFMDRAERDLRNAGYPNARMYSAGYISSFGPAPVENIPIVAVGLVAVSATDLWFEGDVDGNGSVYSVRYRLTADSNGNCPCTLQRSAVPKLAGSPTAQASNFSSQLANVVNSAGGSSAWTIAGTAPNGTAYDTLFAGLKSAPLFQYFDSSNNEIPVPTDLSGGANLSAGVAASSSARYIVVTVNVLSPSPDQQTGQPLSVPMQTSIRLSGQ